MNDGRTEAYLIIFKIKMLFDKDEILGNEKILLESKPNLLFGCKGPILAVITIIFLVIISPTIISFIGKMQVYLIKFVKLSLTYYFALLIFLIIFILLFYIVFKLISWYSIKYILTDSRIIVKKGMLFTKKSYMPYSSIQDINSYQSILAKIFDVSTISIYSAYDNNQMELNYISDSKEIEEIIFSRMNPYMQNNLNQHYFNNSYVNQYPNSYGVNVVDSDNHHSMHDNNDLNDVNISKHNSRVNSENYYQKDDYNKNSNNNYDNFSRDTHYKDTYINTSDYFININDEIKKETSPKTKKKENLSSEKIIERHFEKFKK